MSNYAAYIFGRFDFAGSNVKLYRDKILEDLTLQALTSNYIEIKYWKIGCMGIK